MIREVGVKMKIKKGIISLLCYSLTLLLSSCTGNLKEAIDSVTSEYEMLEKNDKGLDLLDEGRAEEALEFFKENLETYKDDESMLDITYNNISSAYIDLGDYEKGLEYIELALEILPNSAEEYFNMGSILYNLYQLDEALVNYDLALEEVSNYSLAYYGKGQVLYDYQKYDEALENFNKYLKNEPDDIDAQIYKAYCLLFTKGKDDALNQVNKTINKNDNCYDAYYTKGVILEETSTYEEAEAFYISTSKKFHDSLEAQIDLGGFYYTYGKYNKSLIHFQELIKLYPDDVNLYSWLIYNYAALEEYDQALLYGEMALEKDSYNYEIYNAIGNVYLEKTLYMESIQYFDKAIELNPYNEDVYLNKLYALYSGKRYARVIDFSKEAEEIFPNSFDMLWYIAESYFELDQLDEAIKQYESMIKLAPDNDEILSYLASTYLYLEDYDNAKRYMEETLAINSENYFALYVDEELKNKQTPIKDQILNFFDTYYFYPSNNLTENEVDAIIHNEKLTSRSINQLINKMKQPDDYFTYAVYGKEYDYYMGLEEQDLSYDNLSNDAFYIKINTFTSNTDNKFTRLLDSIENPEKKTLIIDLRNNSGGDTNSANNMLDILLPECVTSTLIDKDGYTSNYYSDASFIAFKEIYILVDEYSASASELLTLGLKTYLDNVTVVGRNTFGKGVGQYVFEDKQNKLILLVVNHYWNVRQKNIMDIGIAPDIYVSGDELEQYLNAIDQ